jgi:tRNA pseudouridine55 synthase
MPPEGILVIDKPSHMTSHDVVDRVRRKFHMRRVGHAGTLDPLATGILILLVGKATKLFEKFVAFDKSYDATFLLGTATHSADIEGNITAQKPFDQITEAQVRSVLHQFEGEIEQVPPMVSAVKKGGKKLYQLARKGIEVEREPRKVRVDHLVLNQFEPPDVHIHLACSKGTYVRQLAEDIGNALGCGACVSRIRRTSVGPFSLDEAVSLEEVDENHLRNWKP